MAYSPRPALGQAAMAASEPVVIASDQSAIPVTVSGVATAANQTTIIGHIDGIETLLTTIDGRVDGLETSNSAIQTAVQLIDDSIFVAGTDTFTEATSKGQLGLVVRRDANTSLVNTTNEYTALQVNATGELKTALIQALPAGTNNIGDVDVLSVIPGTSTTNLGKARDVAIGANDVGIAMLGVRRDTPTAETPAAGDYIVPQFSANGEAWVRQQGELADDAAFSVGTTRVLPVGFLADETATDSVDEGDAGVARMTLDRKQIVAPAPHTAGGLLIYKTLDLDESEEEVKATAGQVYSMWVTNLATSTRYIKFYNATAANVTVGTTTPVITIPIPGNATDDITGHFTAGGFGIEFTTAICIAATTGFADNDTGAPGANEVIANIFYK